MLIGDNLWPSVGLLLVVLWLGSIVVDRIDYKIWASRFASLAFLGHAIFLCVTIQPSGVEWFGVGISAGIIAGFIYGGSQIALPVLCAGYRSTVGAAIRNLRSWRLGRNEAANARRRKREAKEWERRARKDYERGAPQRERQRQAEERRRELAAGDAKRCKDARAACELAYSRCAVEIGNRFSRQELERFMATYMGEDHSPEDVERRGEELRKMMEDYRAPAKPQKRVRTIQDLAEWYLREKQSIQSLPLDEDVRQEHLAALDMRYAELTQEVLQSMEP